MSIADIIIIPALVAPLVSAVMLALSGGGWYFFACVLGFYCFFGLCEFLSKKFRGRTISQDIARAKPALFWAIIGSWTLMHVVLSIHWWMCRGG